MERLGLKYTDCCIQNGLAIGSDGKESAEMRETWVGKVSWRMKWLPTPVFLPGECHWTKEPGGATVQGSQRVRHAEQLTLSLSYIK